jgi:two-component system, OmpR family, phosphate regulon sensor histidine kinase PhoR
MLLPLLFSIFLIGVTLASFLILYRSLRQQQRLAMLKNDFISNITHELKTPIATVNVALEALQRFNASNDPAKTAAYIDMSQQELKRLSLLVDKVLRVSMFENSKVELRLERVDLVALIHEVKESMRLQFEKTGTTFNLHLNGIDFTVEADKLHMLSVVYNLLDNAMKYCKAAHDVKGYGLGLSYVAHIVHEHQGKISLLSEEGSGSTFMIQLPKQHG